MLPDCDRPTNQPPQPASQPSSLTGEQPLGGLSVTDGGAGRASAPAAVSFDASIWVVHWSSISSPGIHIEISEVGRRLVWQLREHKVFRDASLDAYTATG